MKFLKVFAAIFIPLALIICFFSFSPRPSIWFLKKTLNKNSYNLPENYETFKDNVKFTRNIDYNSQYPNGVLDIIMPKNPDGREKLILWIHGGAYIAGDKKDVEHYMVMLANHGYVVVNMNYAIAPDSRYPQQLKQIEEVYKFIRKNSQQYNINTELIFFGGDSAGAQLAAQFVNIQTNAEYAKNLNDSLTDISFENTVPEESIKGSILFCGPYNFVELLNPKENTMLLPFKKIGWAYFGSIDINKRADLLLSNIIDKVSENYPPVFITDGNTLSFENQAKDFIKNLEEKNIRVESVFYPKSEASLFHEYQFNMDTKYALNTFEKLLAFLKTHSGVSATLQ